MSHALVGNWLHVRSENFEDLLKAYGTNFVFRKMIVRVNPTVDIVQEENKFTIRTHLPILTQEDVFIVGEEIESVNKQNNQKYKANTTLEDGKIIVEMTPVDAAKAKPQTVTREIQGEEMVMTIKVGDVECKRYFKKVVKPEEKKEEPPAAEPAKETEKAEETTEGS